MKNGKSEALEYNIDYYAFKAGLYIAEVAGIAALAWSQNTEQAILGVGIYAIGRIGNDFIVPAKSLDRVRESKLKDLTETEK